MKPNLRHTKSSSSSVSLLLFLLSPASAPNPAPAADAAPTFVAIDLLWVWRVLGEGCMGEQWE